MGEGGRGVQQGPKTQTFFSNHMKSFQDPQDMFYTWSGISRESGNESVPRKNFTNTNTNKNSNENTNTNTLAVINIKPVVID